MDGILRAWKMVRNFLFSSLNKEFLIFLFFLALSGVFWLLMALNETYEREYKFAVHLTNVPKNVVITDDAADTLSVVIRDKGFTLLAYSYGNQLKPLMFRYGNYANEKTGRGQIPSSDLQKAIYQRLYGSSKIVQMKPDRLDFYFNYGFSKVVPVMFDGTVSTGGTTYLARTLFVPSKVRIFASRELLDSIKYISTKPVDVVNLQDTVIQIVDLQKIRGVKVVPSSVKVILYPDILTEYSLEVPVHAVNMPMGKVLRTFPARVHVKFTVGASQIRSIRPEDFKVVADYNNIEAHPTDKCPLEIMTTPRYVSRPELDIKQIDYLIEQQ